MIVAAARRVVDAVVGEKTDPDDGEKWCRVCDGYVETEPKFKAHDGSVIEGCDACGNTILDPVAPRHADYGRKARG